MLKIANWVWSNITVRFNSTLTSQASKINWLGLFNQSAFLNNTAVSSFQLFYFNSFQLYKATCIINIKILHKFVFININTYISLNIKIKGIYNIYNIHICISYFFKNFFVNILYFYMKIQNYWFNYIFKIRVI